MARKQLSQKSQPSKKTSRGIAVSLESDESVPFFYVNCFEVSSSANDFVLSGARMPVKFSAEKQEELSQTGETSLMADFQIVLPPRIVPKLIAALKDQLESHKKLTEKQPSEE